MRSGIPVREGYEEWDEYITEKTMAGAEERRELIAQLRAKAAVAAESAQLPG